MNTPQPSSSAARSRNSTQPKPLPPGFMNIRDVLDGTISAGKFVCVAGLVKDRRFPIKTGTTDWKSALTIYDKSLEDEPDRGLVINIFRKESEMPKPDAGDVVVVFSAKVQSYRGEISLITNWITAFHVYSAAKIPKPPESAKPALAPPLRPSDRLPGDNEHGYVSWLYHSVDKDLVPDVETFAIRLDESRNVKEKFHTLSDVYNGTFCDMVVNVVKAPSEVMDRVTVWVTDYTENDGFYKFSWDSTEVSEGRDGDPYGYTKKSIPSNNWPGPYGRRSVQVTCFGIHGEFIKKQVKVGSWIRMRNLQIKYGRNHYSLEGFLREDRTAYNPGVRVDLLRPDDPDTIDGRLKDAIRRKRDYEKAKKKQQKSFAANEDGKGNPGIRTTEDRGEIINSAARRAQRRAMAVQEAEKKDLKYAARLGLNEHIKCESIDQPIFAVSSIVAPIPWTTTVNGQEVTLTLPFTCAKYRANVRVVDFWPQNLENFTTWHKTSEYEVLSDHSGDSDSELDDDPGTVDRYAGEKIWEWRFALLLEEADPKRKGECDRFWAVVDNIEAQQLVNLDPSDLKANPDDLHDLKEQLFKLWGNLEECKQQELQRQDTNQKRVAARQPPPTSPPGPSKSHEAEPANKTGSVVVNKPFTCCIRQYGVEVPEDNLQKANAGEGKRWERVFGLFGTRIVSES